MSDIKKTTFFTVNDVVLQSALTNKTSVFLWIMCLISDILLGYNIKWAKCFFYLAFDVL